MAYAATRREVYTDGAHVGLTPWLSQSSQYGRHSRGPTHQEAQQSALESTRREPTSGRGFHDLQSTPTTHGWLPCAFTAPLSALKLLLRPVYEQRARMSPLQHQGRHLGQRNTGRVGGAYESTRWGGASSQLLPKVKSYIYLNSWVPRARTETPRFPSTRAGPACSHAECVVIGITGTLSSIWVH